MARFARVIAVSVPHHITQRGNAQRQVFYTDSDRLVYLDLLRVALRLRQASLVGYCLMPNHVHLVGTPAKEESLALALKDAHGRYATYLNARLGATGHVWQGRYYSCPLDRPHLWRALRYTERNPVRAGLAPRPEAYPWSSAAAHCGLGDPPGLLDMTTWREVWTPAEWRDFVSCGVSDEAECELLRKNTHTGRPLGSKEFVHELEQRLDRALASRAGGRKRRQQCEPAQGSFAF